ncbi:hypothetical protein KFK09_022247 [Dendrobium nobile]|uniref:Transmembrane protein n=1 Tax=Dendrobium nobile TaxID=94219 RepID=A0A8T3AIJ7_DENNO|nr:hypothetical protein KFK09_022247 [Dendrobium nobile]
MKLFNPSETVVLLTVETISLSISFFWNNLFLIINKYKQVVDISFQENTGISQLQTLILKQITVFLFESFNVSSTYEFRIERLFYLLYFIQFFIIVIFYYILYSIFYYFSYSNCYILKSSGFLRRIFSSCCGA